MGNLINNTWNRGKVQISVKNLATKKAAEWKALI